MSVGAVAYPICCQYPAPPPADGPNRKRFSRNCLDCNVTVCTLLTFTGSWVRSLPVFTTLLQLLREALLSHARAHTHTLIHVDESKACCSKFVPQTTTNLCDPNGVLKSLVLQYGITAQVGVHLLVTATANTEIASRTLPACLPLQFCNCYRS